mmetsp:Transcript_54561/g.61764  ORF Transcript_54561/g.61764 Transcript_54561/m.61764 type:complete len:84 (-) Transcript_54561:23-274(-)
MYVAMKGLEISSVCCIIRLIRKIRRTDFVREGAVQATTTFALAKLLITTLTLASDAWLDASSFFLGASNITWLYTARYRKDLA